ncbi:NAD(P)/FAD-dependent oxidoreductase [Desulfothermus sp.]
MAKKDRLDLGAVLQRDKETYAIVPHIAGGICTPETLRKIADVAEKYNAKAIKVTGAQRLAIVGLQEEDLEKAWKDLGMKPAAAVGMCVRSVKICPGTTFCRLGKQDSVKVGLKLDELYHAYNLPAKFKIGVSGCPNCCADSWFKDIGLIGTSKGWQVVVGGNGGSKPRIADLIAQELSDDAALNLIQKIIDTFKEKDKPGRIGTYIDKVGIEKFKQEIGIS